MEASMGRYVNWKGSGNTNFGENKAVVATLDQK